ncbi:hypothetical protein P170DRAFT_434230 [Aspergillus steynii IBT 23096]|uniref:Zn(2)-C6 fungal-type domain-containing protein n=1 Tax=Aspergillus steynii IBT 23096 TaxID=1392250 RepID=A0A2I2GHV6_9EURO|nr:uncharacterized protein P170DRAFT_434230 [Aspergillus steynii IBT 23096]PLB52461.1 hypothetical protein P170DRAFT_434230 [Aspergillus steynii IBT 23096]
MSMLVHDLGLLRRACDRCHGQKLRCRRENNSEPCVRCQRAGVQCAPRPVRSRHRPRAHTTQQSAGISNATSTQSIVNAPEQTNKDESEHFHLSPSSLLDFPADLDLGLDFASPQSEMGNPLEARDLQSSMDLGPIQNHPPSQPFPLELRSGMGGRFEPEQQNEVHAAPQSSYIQPSAASAVLPCSRPATTHSQHRLSLTRTVAPKHITINGSSQELNDLMDFDHEGGTALNTGSEDTTADSGYGHSVSSRPHSNSSGTQSSYPPHTSKSAGDMTSWVRKLSDINVELHQHMLAIPSVDVEHSPWTNCKTSNDPSFPHELAVDRTFKLSHQYTETLNDIFSQCKTRQTQTGSPPAARGALALDQPSQLLVLSSYLCLVEAYDKILQHIKAWTEVRLTLGGATAGEHFFPVQLPRLAIGCFQLPASSSTRPLVLICIIEATMTQIHDQMNEMMRPARTIGEQGILGGDGLSGVAKVTVQAIRTKEDSTMKLLHVVWRLALRSGDDRKLGAGAD